MINQYFFYKERNKMENNKNLETHNENLKTLKKGYFEKYPLLNKIKKGSFLKKLPFKPYRLDAIQGIFLIQKI
tara:strand:- start:4890 stop:5108 length:219 start_codon:yes stop_codon:yes gene_type:complete